MTDTEYEKMAMGVPLEKAPEPPPRTSRRLVVSILIVVGLLAVAGLG